MPLLKGKANTSSTYSVVSIKRTGGHKRTGWAEFFHLVQGGAKNIFITLKMKSG